MSGAVAVGVLAACGTYLVLQRGLVRTLIGFVLIEHALNVLLVLAGGAHRRQPPLTGVSGERADPLVQAFVLTAIVIGLGTTVLLISLSFRVSRAEQDIEEEP